MIRSFADLLHPHDPALLLEAAAAGKRLQLRTGRADAFARLMPWELLNDLITADKVLSGDIEFARNDAVLPAEMTIVRPRRQKPPTRMRTQALEQYARQGVSIVVNGVEAMVPEIQRTNAIVEREFRAHVQTNLYASFGRDGAFRPHWDTHNVLVLQVHGRKHWRSWGQPWRSPVSRSDCKVAADPGPALWEAVLEPGDLLYLPRGEVHAARLLEGGDSLHLTIGILPPRIDALVETLAALCREDPVGRQDLPILADPAARDAWMNDAKALLHRAVDRLDLDQVLDALDRAVEPLAPGFLGIDRCLTRETLVRPTLRRRLPLPPGVGEDARIVTAGGQSWTVTAIEVKILDQVQRHHSRTVANLMAAMPGTDETALTDAVRTLAGKGVVSLHNADIIPPG